MLLQQLQKRRFSSQTADPGAERRADIVPRLARCVGNRSRIGARPIAVLFEKGVGPNQDLAFGKRQAAAANPHSFGRPQQPRYREPVRQSPRSCTQGALNFIPGLAGGALNGPGLGMRPMAVRLEKGVGPNEDLPSRKQWPPAPPGPFDGARVEEPGNR